MAGLATALGLLALIGGGVYFVEDRYAKQVHLVQVERRLDYKIKQDQLYGIQARLWALYDRYGEKCQRADREVRETCADLEQTSDRLRRELKELEGPRP